jgi:hypothetical protein
VIVVPIYPMLSAPGSVNMLGDLQLPYHRTAITIISHVHTIAGYAQLVRDKLEEDLTVLLILFSTDFTYACL